MDGLGLLHSQAWIAWARISPARPESSELTEEISGFFSSDRRHIFNFTVVGDAPKFGNLMLRTVVSGWQIAGIYRAQSAPWLTVTMTPPDRQLSGANNQRPVQVLPDTLCSNPTSSCWINPAAFALPAFGTLSTMNRANVPGPAFWQFDLVLSRNFRITERQKVQVRGEAFNLTNSFRAGVPPPSLSAGCFGSLAGAGFADLRSDHQRSGSTHHATGGQIRILIMQTNPASFLCIIFGCAFGAHAQGPVDKDAYVLGFRMHYRESGRGPAVVLLHGLGADGSRWAPNMAPLSRHFRIIALDQIGFGQSDKPMTNYHIGMLSEFLVRFLAAIGLSKATLVGNSMGAQVALYTAVHYPAVAERLVLVDGGRFRAARMPTPLTPDPHRLKVLTGVKAEETKELLRLLFHNKSLITGRMVEDYLRVRLQSAYAIEKIVDSGLKALATISEDEVRAVKSPTLIVWGKYDEMADPADADRLAGTIPGARKVLIDDAGHLPQLEKPDDFNRLLTEFLLAGSGRPLPQ